MTWGDLFCVVEAGHSTSVVTAGADGPAVAPSLGLWALTAPPSPRALGPGRRLVRGQRLLWRAVPHAGFPRAATVFAGGDWVLRRPRPPGLLGHRRRPHAAAGGDRPRRPSGGPDFSGEKALMSGDVRRATCVANADAKCLTLLREDFVWRLGNPQDLLDWPPSQRGCNPRSASASAKFASNIFPHAWNFAPQ